MQNDATSLHNLDVASRSLDSLSHFVSLINSSADISESRLEAGLPILDVQWAHNKKLESIRPVIRSLDQLLGMTTPTHVYIYVQDELIKDAKEARETAQGQWILFLDRNEGQEALVAAIGEILMITSATRSDV
uniref:Uncharacterized protein n=1 Tax=Timema cristinae TaxID=61476 RepID=A0A7R9GYE1_TIMCR|nr:unnamed protein product [Timema cristinae]